MRPQEIGQKLAREGCANQQAKAVVRFHKSATASAEDWNGGACLGETTICGEQGETIVIRLIEHQ